jgi:hypothetical protein
MVEADPTDAVEMGIGVAETTIGGSVSATNGGDVQLDATPRNLVVPVKIQVPPSASVTVKVGYRNESGDSTTFISELGAGGFRVFDEISSPDKIYVSGNGGTETIYWSAGI